MLFFFLVYIVPALTFTLSENVIKDDVEVDRKNLKSLYSISPKMKGKLKSSDKNFRRDASAWGFHFHLIQTNKVTFNYLAYYKACRVSGV